MEALSFMECKVETSFSGRTLLHKVKKYTFRTYTKQKTAELKTQKENNFSSTGSKVETINMFPLLHKSIKHFLNYCTYSLFYKKIHYVNLISFC
jgi:hypothetical protein